MKTLIIDRQKWQTGDEHLSYLLNTITHKMCCLGFYSKNCGLSDEDISDIGAPSRLTTNIPNEMNWLVESCETEPYGFDNAQIGYELMRINDKPLSKDFLQKDREKLVSEMFADHDVKVEYIN